MSTILELKGITKQFANSTVLDHIDLAFEQGELHALVGENGAGKSTMIKIISGVYQADDGELWLNGKRVSYSMPSEAQRAGISTLFQEIQEIPEMTVAENIFLGREPRYGGIPIVNRKQMVRAAKELIDRLGLHLSATAKMRDLPVSSRKMVEIARAVNQNASVVIMDEPTANLNVEEMDALFRMIDELKKQHTTIIYISHRMNEVFSLSDRISVLRDGKLIATLDSADCNEKNLIPLMIGRELTDLYPQREHRIGEVVLDVKDFSLGNHFQNVSFQLHAGEVLGFAGLDSSGANAVTKTLFGLCGTPSGSVQCGGVKLESFKPAKSIKNNIAFLPEDRKTQGLFLNQNLVSNITISSLGHLFSRHSVLKRGDEVAASRNVVDRLHVKAAGLHTRPEELSGGNQQKVLLGRWMIDAYKVLIMEEPTRGVDVGAKSEIYAQINQLAEKGLAVIMYSTEMPELLGMCDRKIPIEGGGVERYPRWTFWSTMQNGVTIVHVDLLCANKMKPSKETLAQESAILQGILLDDLQRGLIPLVAHPTYTDGTPTLSLVGVGQYGQYMTFSFVWVNSRKTADYVHLHDIPPVSDDADDRDF